MNEMDLSIIVPIYNTEQYISRCVNSILQLKNIKFEILLINDGSNDASEKICKEFEQVYSNIHYFYQENQGVSVARNNGIQHATGKYIAFVDSDDYWYDINTKDVLDAIETDADLVYSTAYYREDEEKRTLIRRDTIEIENTLFSSIIEKTKNGGWANWLYLFRRDIINQYEVAYRPKIRVAEDAEFFFMYCKNISDVCFINSAHYVYCVERPYSAMNSGKGKALFSFYRLLKSRLEENNDEMDEQINKVLIMNFHKWLGYIYLLKKSERREIYHFIVQKDLLKYMDATSRDYLYIMRKGYRKYIRKSSIHYFLISVKGNIIRKLNSIKC